MIPNLCVWSAAEVSSGSAVCRYHLSSVVGDKTQVTLPLVASLHPEVSA